VKKYSPGYYLADLKKKVAGKQVAFLLGNGINRYHHDSYEERSWETLLLELYTKFTGDKLKEIPIKGLSFPEFFDLILLRSGDGEATRKNLIKEFIKGMNAWKPAQHHIDLVKFMQENDLPVLTTNFDPLLIKASHAKKFFTIENRKKDFSAHYPWQCFYSTENAKGFALWHLNGLLEYESSIKLGLVDYSGNIAKARNLLPIRKMRKTYFPGENTWLQPFLSKSIVVIGSGLDDQEVFLRWLLLKRALWVKKNPKLNNSSWYLCTDLSQGKRFFLESVGFKILECDYAFMYEEQFGELGNRE
jgi:hypothetical protein